MAILIVDDSEDMRELLADVLRAGGHPDVITASSAQEAFGLLGLLDNRKAAAPVDLILMDITMTGIDGIAACEFIKSEERTRDVQVLIVTGKPEEQNLQKAFDAGACDYIRKPVESPVLVARVNFALRLKHETDRRKQREAELLETKALLERANDELLRLATLDGLTGVANRRRLDEYLDQEWRRASREHQPLGLILLDLDHFKRYNDSHGHQAGDNCLKLISRSLLGALHRPADLVARYGGEELAVVLPATDLSGAVGVAERLRGAVGALKIPHGSSVACHVTVSLGAASQLPSPVGSPDDLIAEADAALYRAKQAGRNCVSTAEDATEHGGAAGVPPPSP